jgi:hypothetical protein
MAARTPKIRPALPATVVRSAPFFEGDEVLVVEVGFKSLLSEFVGVTKVVVLSEGREKSEQVQDLSDRHRGDIQRGGSGSSTAGRC